MKRRSIAITYVSALYLATVAVGVFSQCLDQYEVGETWYPVAGDKCYQCTCQEDDEAECKNTCVEQGSVASTASTSVRSESKAASKYSCMHDNTERSNNETWTESGSHASGLDHEKRECMLCHCWLGIVTCTVRTCPMARCSNPVQEPGSCCKACPGVGRQVRDLASEVCNQFGSVFREISTWRMYFPNGGHNVACLNCHCSKMSDDTFQPTCKRHKCPDLDCLSVERKPGECCGVCKKNQNGGDHQPSSLYMKQIMKIGGIMTLELLNKMSRISEDPGSADPAVPDSHIQMPAPTPQSTMEEDISLRMRTGAHANKCAFGSKIYQNQETFIPEISSCLRCHCKAGRVSCNRIVCPAKYECPRPEIRSGLCCRVCPGISINDAKQIEQRQMVKVAKRLGGCSQVKADRIQVYEHKPLSRDASVVRRQYLFDRTHQPGGAPSELHTWEMVGAKIRVTTEEASDEEVLENAESWTYLGSIKDKILSRFIKLEEELRQVQGAREILQKIDSVSEYIQDKAGRRRYCRSSSTDASAVLKTLQEVG